MANVTSLLQQAIEHYKPGGEFATVRAEQLKGKERTVTAGMESQLVGRGLAGTTVGAAIPAAVEQQVSAPWRTETEMMRGGRLMEAVTAQAGFQERAQARRSAEQLARERMELQRDLQDVSLSAQEKAAKQGRLHEIEMQEREWGREEWKREQGWGAGADVGADAGYEYPSAPSLVDTGAGVGAGIGGKLPGVGPTLEPAPEDWFTQMGKIAEQWLTEPSVARGPDLGIGDEEGDLSQAAFQRAKTAGTPWTYNYGTWLAAKRSGKI